MDLQIAQAPSPDILRNFAIAQRTTTYNLTECLAALRKAAFSYRGENRHWDDPQTG